jgi:ABC-type phosphate transport system substrate-binding protein
MQKRIFLAILSLSALASFAQLLTVNAAFEQVDVVVNKTNGVSSLSLQELRMIFLGEKSSWPGGKHITVLMLERGQPERQVILRELYNMNESDYTKYFLQAAFAGRVQAAPRNLASAAEMKARLAANPNAIGYLKKEDLDDSVKTLLKIP